MIDSRQISKLILWSIDGKKMSEIFKHIRYSQKMLEYEIPLFVSIFSLYKKAGFNNCHSY